MTPEYAAISVAIAQQQTQQAQNVVVQDISAEAGGGSAPILSSSVTAPGALEMFV